MFSRVGMVDKGTLVRDTEEGWLFSGICLRFRPNSQFFCYRLTVILKKYVSFITPINSVRWAKNLIVFVFDSFDFLFREISKFFIARSL